MKKGILFFLMCCFLAAGTHPSQALTLKEAIRIGLKNNPGLLIQQKDLKEAKEEKYSKKASNFGSLFLSGSYTHYNIPRTLAPLTPPISPNVLTSKDISSAGIIYTVTLFNGFSDIRAIKIATLGEAISKTRLKLTREELIFNITSLYLKILSLKSQEKAALSYKKALDELYSNVSAEVKMGRKARIDLLKIASNLEEANFLLEKIKNSINSLESLLGTTIGVDHRVEVEPLSPSHLSLPFYKTSLSHTYRYRLAKLQLSRAKETLKKTESMYYPKIGVDVYWGNNYAKGEQEEIWQAQVNLKWLLFDFGVRHSRIKKASLAVKKALLSLKRTRLELKSKIIDAKAKIATAREKITSLKKQVDFLQKVKVAERVKYEKGASNMYDLLFAYASFQRARSEYIEAKYDFYVQRLYLRYLMAGER